MNTLSWWTPCRKYSSPPVCPASLDEQRKLLRTMRDSTTAVLHMVPFKLSHDKERKEIERDRVRQRQEKLKRERQRDRETENVYVWVKAHKIIQTDATAFLSTFLHQETKKLFSVAECLAGVRRLQ